MIIDMRVVRDALSSRGLFNSDSYIYVQDKPARIFETDDDPKLTCILMDE